MLFTQFVDTDLGCASYLIGDEHAGVVAVVDPAYAVEQYLEEAAARDVRIVHVVETHTHADHVSGHGRLALEHGVPISIHPLAGVDYPHDPLPDGAEIALGDVTLRCIHTPGHRPEHCCIAVIDRSRADEPWLLLTGDSLFVGDAARPDLAVGAIEGAEGLFHSLRRILELPDGVEVYPGHVAGSLCGTAMSTKASTTIGFERRFNPALLLDDLDRFVALSAGIDAPKPPNLARIVELNRGPLLPAQPDPVELSAPPAGGQVLDVRPFPAFAAGHRAGAVNVPVSGSGFATKAGFVLDPELPLAVAADTDDAARRAVRGLRSIGFLDVAGLLSADGPETLETVGLDELDRLLAAGAELIDVREREEHEAGSVPGSRNVPYRLLAGAELPRGRTIVTICESSPRAAVAASVLAARGYDARPVVDGGITDLLRDGSTVVQAR
jgi:hydroxyacylglutathione hydrolase